jgi:hypothetical protein
VVGMEGRTLSRAEQKRNVRTNHATERDAHYVRMFARALKKCKQNQCSIAKPNIPNTPNKTEHVRHVHTVPNTEHPEHTPYKGVFVLFVRVRGLFVRPADTIQRK